MKIAISVESTHDLSPVLLNKYDISVIPYQINLGDLSFKDGKYLTEEMFELVEKYKTLPKTTAINEYEYTEYFKALLNDYDAVVHICLSSGITSSCGNAIRAAANVKNVSLTNFDVIAEEAAKEGYIRPEDISRLIKFRNNPSDEGWRE